jgi:hypothetical protein
MNPTAHASSGCCESAVPEDRARFSVRAALLKNQGSPALTVE